MESETVLRPVQTDTDSHRPLMSDDEEEDVVYIRKRRSVQQLDEPPAESSQAISFCKAFLLPGVLPVSRDEPLKHRVTNEDEMTRFSHLQTVSVPQYSLSFACLKLVNYSFFFWLPFYLSNNYGWKEAEADRLSVWYDVGGIIGE